MYFCAKEKIKKRSYLFNLSYSHGLVVEFGLKSEQIFFPDYCFQLALGM